jgi:hypothetical protein
MSQVRKEARQRKRVSWAADDRSRRCSPEGARRCAPVERARGPPLTTVLLPLNLAHAGKTVPSPKKTLEKNKPTKQGTLYERDGALSGDLAIVGGTGAFKGLRGSEKLAYDTNSKTGTVKFSVL